MVLCCLFWCQSFCDVSSYVCSNYFSSVATFCEITAHSVDHMFSPGCSLCILKLKLFPVLVLRV